MDLPCHYSCLIARNLLNGLKTCWEVFQYMTSSGNKLFGQAGDGANSLLEGYAKFDFNGNVVSIIFCLAKCIGQGSHFVLLGNLFLFLF